MSYLKDHRNELSSSKLNIHVVNKACKDGLISLVCHVSLLFLICAPYPIDEKYLSLYQHNHSIQFQRPFHQNICDGGQVAFAGAQGVLWDFLMLSCCT